MYTVAIYAIKCTENSVVANPYIPLLIYVFTILRHYLILIDNTMISFLIAGGGVSLAGRTCGSTHLPLLCCKMTLTIYNAFIESNKTLLK